MINSMFNCVFCNERFDDNKEVFEHEGTCYSNPNRNCDTCNNTGIEKLRIIHNNGSVASVMNERPCSSCGVANLKGGKSYIESKSEGGV